MTRRKFLQHVVWEAGDGTSKVWSVRGGFLLLEAKQKVTYWPVKFLELYLGFLFESCISGKDQAQRCDKNISIHFKTSHVTCLQASSFF